MPCFCSRKPISTGTPSAPASAIADSSSRPRTVRATSCRRYPDLTVLDIDAGPTPTQERMSLALLEAVRSDKLHQGSDVVVV